MLKGSIFIAEFVESVAGISCYSILDFRDNPVHGVVPEIDRFLSDKEESAQKSNQPRTKRR
jgi:hypothetical protein